MKKIRYFLFILLLPAFVLTGCDDNEGPEPTSYTVTFQTNGGSAVTSQTVTEGQKATRPADPVRTDYTFAGWFSNTELTVLYDFDAAVTANVTIYAKWILASATTYTVTFDSNGGNNVDQQTVEEGRKATAPPMPTKEGFDFAGWFRSADLTATWDFDADVVTADITLYAKWIPASGTTYTVTFNSNGGSEVPSLNVSEDGKVMRPTPPVKEDEAFAGWYTESAMENLYDFDATVTADLTLYAKWAAVSLETLSTLVDEARALNENRYTSASYSVMYEACMQAAYVMEEIFDPSQEQINEAYETLRAALNGLVEVPYRTAVRIHITPGESDGFVYVAPGQSVYLSAGGVDANDYIATESRVIFDTGGFEEWFADGQITVYDDHVISFQTKSNLALNATANLTIRSMDPRASNVLRSVTFKVSDADELRNRLTEMVDALPAPSEISL